MRQRGGIAGGGGHAIHRSGQARAPRGQHQRPAQRGQLGLIGAAGHAQIQLQIEVAQHQAQHLGRTTQVWQIDLRNDAGELTCVSRITMAVLQPKA